MSDFPVGSDLPVDALDSETLFVMHNGQGHVAATNKILAFCRAAIAKFGIGSSAPAAGQTLEGTSTAGSTAWVDRLTPSMLPNGEFRVDQQIGPYTSTGSRNNDAVMTLDGTWLLSDGNNIVSVTQELTDVPAGAFAACKMICTTANKKAGIVQYLTKEQAAELINGTASASIAAHTTAAKVVNKVRTCLIGWSGTADAFTRDVVSGTSWGASGTNPTLAAGWVYAGTPQELSLTTAYQTLKCTEGVSGVGYTNMALFAWVDDTDMAINDEVFFADFHPEPGTVSHKLKRTTNLAAELACLEQYVVLNGALLGNGGTFASLPGNGYTTLTTNADIRFDLPVPMRALPSLTANGTWQVLDMAAGGFAVTGFAIYGATISNRKLVNVACTISGATAGRFCTLRVNNDATTRMILDARPGV